MGKTIIFLKKQSGLKSVDSKTLTEYTFAEHVMNINLKLSTEVSQSLTSSIAPLLAKEFLRKNESSAKEFISAFINSLEDNKMKEEVCQLKNDEEKISLFFKLSISNFQDMTKNKGFSESIEKNQEFYLLALSCFETLSLSYIASINEKHESFL